MKKERNKLNLVNVMKGKKGLEANWFWLTFFVGIIIIITLFMILNFHYEWLVIF